MDYSELPIWPANREQNSKHLKLEECHLYLLNKDCIDYLYCYNTKRVAYQQIKGSFILKC